jgi:hypothetical protein
MGRDIDALHEANNNIVHRMEKNIASMDRRMTYIQEVIANTDNRHHHHSRSRFHLARISPMITMSRRIPTLIGENHTAMRGIMTIINKKA